jgi:hypothetical protein
VRTFLAGFVLGAALAAVVVLLVVRGDEPAGAPPPPAPADTRDPPAPPPGPQRPEGSASAGRKEASFEPGTALLRIGEGYVFGETSARPDAEQGEVDLLCLDIGSEILLRCPHGCAPAALPVLFSGETPGLQAAFDLVEDAPVTLRKRTAALRGNPLGLDSGVLLVGDPRGGCHKVILEHAHRDPHALRRWIRIRHAEVPRRPGGGVLKIAGAEGSRSADKPTAEAVEDLLAPLRKLPPQWAVYLPRGPTTIVERLPEGFVVAKSGTIVVEEAQDASFVVEEDATLVLRGGLSPDARITAKATLGLVVEGDLAGTVVGDRTFVHVRGDLTGELTTKKITVIDGNIYGVLRVTGIPRVLLRGRVLDPETGLVGDGIPTFFFETYTPLAEIRRFPKRSGIWKLHVRDSDLPPGRHTKDVGMWSSVDVADPVWEALGR